MAPLVLLAFVALVGFGVLIVRLCRVGESVEQCQFEPGEALSDT
jgi:hypothetical protein